MSLLADPWSTTDPNSSSEPIVHGDGTPVAAALQFEDDFEPSDIEREQQRGQRLPDSDSYLAALERRLKRIKTNPTVLQQLAERREACMQYLLNDSSAPSHNELNLALDEPVFNNELLRFIRPEQALSVAELAHLVKYDHLEAVEQPTEQQQQDYKEGEESGTESSTSR